MHDVITSLRLGLDPGDMFVSPDAGRARRFRYDREEGLVTCPDGRAVLPLAAALAVALQGRDERRVVVADLSGATAAAPPALPRESLQGLDALPLVLIRAGAAVDELRSAVHRARSGGGCTVVPAGPDNA